MRTQFQGAIVAILKEGFAIDAQEFLGSLDGDPSSDFGHGAEKRLPSYSIDPLA